MVNGLYWVSALTYAIMLGLILLHDIRTTKKPTREEKSFRVLVVWVVFFCLQDVLWGLSASDVIMNDTLLFISSTIFHSSTVLTTFFWLKYVLNYLGSKVRRPKIYLAFDLLVMAVQFTLVIVNFFTPTIFFVNEIGAYDVAFLRPLAFFNQYIVYLVIGMIALVNLLFEKKGGRTKYLTVFFFSLAPILTGVFQLLYPDGPFYSLGYALGCFIIHLFIVSNDRAKIERLQFEHDRLESEKIIAQQRILSSTDPLTGLKNRRSYEEDLLSFEREKSFVYVSADVNGLKVINDTLGHAAGDEVIKAAADCLKQAFGAYGSVYRIGGDEYAALLTVPKDKLKELELDFDRLVALWSGQLVHSLSISFASVAREDEPDLSVEDIAKIADSRMYDEKRAYYLNHGIDKRAKEYAYRTIVESYTKILKVNLVKDEYDIIKVDNMELSTERGYRDSLSSWLKEFALSGRVHQDDQSLFLEKTDLETIKKYFLDGHDYYCVPYRRLCGREFRWALLELVPEKNYAPENQIVFLYVKKTSEFNS